MTVGQVTFGNLGDTCGPDHICNGTLCVPRPNGEGDLCAGAGACPPDLSCIDPDADGVQLCEPRPGNNQPCNLHDGSLACIDEHYCRVGTNTSPTGSLRNSGLQPQPQRSLPAQTAQQYQASSLRIDA